MMKIYRPEPSDPQSGSLDCGIADKLITLIIYVTNGLRVKNFKFHWINHAFFSSYQNFNVWFSWSWNGHRFSATMKICANCYIISMFSLKVQNFNNTVLYDLPIEEFSVSMIKLVKIDENSVILIIQSLGSWDHI